MGIWVGWSEVVRDPYPAVSRGPFRDEGLRGGRGARLGLGRLRHYVGHCWLVGVVVVVGWCFRLADGVLGGGLSCERKAEVIPLFWSLWARFFCFAICHQSHVTWHTGGSLHSMKDLPAPQRSITTKMDSKKQTNIRNEKEDGGSKSLFNWSR